VRSGPQLHPERLILALNRMRHQSQAAGIG